mmetsp:Transcript_591/g.1617  ORF Transcript_591/g.1617 Transcript_591/m.1617 type:complete len:418 (-) Transcript_591:65-1318(-)
MVAARHGFLLAALAFRCCTSVFLGCVTQKDRVNPFGDFQAAVESSALGTIDATQDQCKKTKSNGKRRFVLVTSLFVPTDTSSGHTIELFAALVVNLANPFIEDVHVLLESAGKDECAGFPATLAAYAPAGLAPNGMGKITCVPVGRQPTYADFFKYVNSALPQRDVLLANTDVVFDATLSLLERPLRTDMAHVLSVQPPLYSGRYKEIFGTECSSTPRCTQGKYNGFAWTGNSFDAYLFRSPLPQGINMTSIDHVMNLLGAENGAAYELEVNGGRKLSNPCVHVHAYHWHCVGGKMHNSARCDNVHEGNLNCVVPCWNCPGMAETPAKAQKAESWCRVGKVLAFANLPPRLKRTVIQARLFRFPDTIRMCVSEGTDIWQIGNKLLQKRLPICGAPANVDCVVGLGENVPHRRYIHFP